MTRSREGSGDALRFLRFARTMLARIQQFLVLALLGSAVAWFAYFALRGNLLAAGFGASLLVMGYSLFLAGEFLFLWWSTRLPNSSGPGGPDLVAAWAGELLVAPRVFFWQQPFRSKAIPDRPSVFAAKACGVVLVHGFVCNRGLWNGWMRELAAAHVPFVAVNLEPVFGSISRYPGIIESAVALLESSTGRQVILVGHSMGGLAIRAWLATHQVPASRVRRVVTIGTPHLGTWLARFASTKNGKEMQIGSEWLQSLASREVNSHHELFTCFYGPCDNIVFPLHCGTLRGAENRRIERKAHMHMAFAPEPYAEVLRWALCPVMPQSCGPA